MATAGAWLPLADVLSYLGLPADSSEAPAVDRSRLAATAYVERQRADLLLYDVDGVPVDYEPTPDVLAGAMLLAARLHARKSSPTGLASYGEFGPAAVLRFDPDLERLLAVGRYARPVVG